MTTVQTIIDAAVQSSQWNDGATTSLANNTSELVGVLSRAIRQVYTLAGLPPEAGGFEQHHAAFVRATTVTMGSPATTRVNFPAETIRLLALTDAGDDYVAQVDVLQVRRGVAEIPPAVIVADRTVRSAGRTGDPTAGAVLTADICYIPAVMTAASDFLGATTLGDASSSQWPEAAGDPFLVAWLARYLAQKEDRSESIPGIEAQLTQAAQMLGALLGVASARLTAIDAGD